MNTIKNIRRAVLAAALVGVGGAAFAQNATITERQNGNSNTTRFDVAQNRVTAPRNSGANLAAFDIAPILQRAAQLRQAAQSKGNNRNTAASARSAYRASVTAFDKMFSIAGRKTTSTAAQSGFTSVSSAQSEQDIRLLRFAMQQTKNPKMQQIAESYAAAMNQFFAAQLRDALYGKDFEPRSGVVLKGFPARTNINVSQNPQYQGAGGGQNPASPAVTPATGGAVILPQPSYPTPPVVIPGNVGNPVPYTTPTVPADPTVPPATIP